MLLPNIHCLPPLNMVLHSQRTGARFRSSDGQTANLDRLNTPGEGFLWHLRRTLDNNNSDDTKARSKTADIEHNKTWAGADAGAGAGSTLDSASIVVLPPPGHDEITGYNGGYTVKRHGTAERVDAVQLEFGRSFRGTAEGREMTAEVNGVSFSMAFVI